MEKKLKNENSFESNLGLVDEIISKLENGDLELEESIKEYEKAMKLLKKSSDILNKAQGKIIKITENLETNNLEMEEV